jgi:hypothetical protein
MVLGMPTTLDYIIQNRHTLVSFKLLSNGNKIHLFSSRYVYVKPQSGGSMRITCTLKIVWSEPKPSRKVKEKENKSFVAVNFKSSFPLKGGKS